MRSVAHACLILPSPVASKIQEIKSIEKNAHMNKKGPVGIKCNKEKYTYALDI